MKKVAEHLPPLPLTPFMLEQYRLYDPETYQLATDLKKTGDVVIVDKLPAGAYSCKA